MISLGNKWHNCADLRNLRIAQQMRTTAQEDPTAQQQHPLKGVGVAALRSWIFYLRTMPLRSVTSGTSND